MTDIDVSKHQGMIDWSKVKMDFAILRAGFIATQARKTRCLNATTRVPGIVER